MSAPSTIRLTPLTYLAASDGQIQEGFGYVIVARKPVGRHHGETVHAPLLHEFLADQVDRLLGVGRTGADAIGPDPVRGAFDRYRPRQ